MARTSNRKGNRRERKEIPSMKFRRNYSGRNFKEVPFFKKYPEIANIIVDVKQAHPDFLGHHEFRFDKTHFERPYSERIPCFNFSCKRGEVSLTPFLREMLNKRRTELRVNCACPGFEKKSRSSSPCGNQIEITIRIEYFDAEIL